MIGRGLQGLRVGPTRWSILYQLIRIKVLTSLYKTLAIAICREIEQNDVGRISSCSYNLITPALVKQNPMTDFERWLPWLVLIVGATSLLLYCLPKRYGSFVGRERTANRIQILVLGDLGRSPRMQYHALSVARHGCHVDLIGYLESDLHPEILANPDFIHIFSLNQTPDFINKYRHKFSIYGPLKVLFQIWTLWLVLGYRTKPARWMIVQNPPSIPTLFLAWVFCFLRNTRLVIDWHNFGYSILALKLGGKHPLVQISRVYEWIFARSAYAHFCVTNAMGCGLASNYAQSYQITAEIRPLHDRPASHFQVLSEGQRFDFLDRLAGLLASGDEQKLLEYLGLVKNMYNRKCKLLVSSTSWTPDEDFSILLDALINYSHLAGTSHPELPEIFAVITGKGPQKDAFLKQIKDLKAAGTLEFVTIETAFLSTDDYAKLLGSADLGVSLHTSSSGVDLPMKVVDMFGAGLPVVGWGDFEAWPELVHEGVNGMSFRNSRGLLAVLRELFGGDGRVLGMLKEGAVEEGKKKWDDEWDRVAGTLFFPSGSF